MEGGGPCRGMERGEGTAQRVRDWKLFGVTQIGGVELWAGDELSDKLEGSISVPLEPAGKESGGRGRRPTGCAFQALSKCPSVRLGNSLYYPI